MIEIFASAFITFKEGFEALLLIFGLLAVSNQKLTPIVLGVVTGLLACFGSAYLVAGTPELSTDAQLVLTLITIGTLFFIAFSGKSSANWANSILSNETGAVMPSIYMFMISLLIIAREGLEVIASMLGMIAKNPTGSMVGTLIGLASLVAISKLAYTYMRKVDMRLLFAAGNITFISIALYYLYEVFTS
jgi:high-affinity Fe2+/Pb2+ permease